jgi:cyanate lyase
MIMSFLKEVQTGPNGPWTKQFRDRVQKVKDSLGLSLQDLGDNFGFSGSFVHGLLAGKPNYHMHSKHASKVLQMLEGLEVQAGIKKLSAPPVSAPAASDLAALVKQINAMGFSVELKPLAA